LRLNAGIASFVSIASDVIENGFEDKREIYAENL